jgi:rhodanese-related sulfurtransferase
MVSAIPGKRWRPQDLNIDDGLENIASQVGDQPVVVYCAGPHCNAAEEMVLKLTEHGVANIFVFQGGLAELRLLPRA